MARQDAADGPEATGTLTHFAPAERDEDEKVRELSRHVRNDPLLQAILASVDGYLMILNPQRQVLAVNQQLLDILRLEAPTCLVGERPGEVLGCIHAGEGPGGCGTSRVCQTCGAVISILGSQKLHHPVENECLATIRHGSREESYEYRVRATPVRVGDHELTVLVFHDISGDKRRDALERTFFHDILNTVGGLVGWSSLMQTRKDLDPREAAARILVLSTRLQQEIVNQRCLIQAENGTLEPKISLISVREILEAVRSVFDAHNVAKEKTLAIDPVADDETVMTDPMLLERILTNMVKNGFEAILPGETVRLWFEKRGEDVVFFVHNPGVMPEDVQLRMFKRSFSTKSAKGRGIGTYSMKLFGEQYLKGEVGFESTPERGTIFWIKCPRTLTNPIAARETA